MKDLIEGVAAELRDARADLLFDPSIEDLDNGDVADHVLLAVAAMETAEAHLRMAARKVVPD